MSTTMSRASRIEMRHLRRIVEIAEALIAAGDAGAVVESPAGLWRRVGIALAEAEERAQRGDVFGLRRWYVVTFFMGLFFLIAGYLTPAALQRTTRSRSSSTWC